jgi:hypothetical protein
MTSPSLPSSSPFPPLFPVRRRGRVQRHGAAVGPRLPQEDAHLRRKRRIRICYHNRNGQERLLHGRVLLHRGRANFEIQPHLLRQLLLRTGMPYKTHNIKICPKLCLLDVFLYYICVFLYLYRGLKSCSKRSPLRTSNWRAAAASARLPSSRSTGGT